MYTSEQLEVKIREFLAIVARNEKLAKLYTFKVNIEKELNSDLLVKLVTEPHIIQYDDDSGRLFYEDENKEKKYCPEIQEGVSVSRDWISDSLPSVPFDISQGGNLRKAAEAENIYKCILIAGILRGEFIDEFKSVCCSYDFEEFKTNDENSLNFSELLSKWQELQNFTIRVIVSGANYKISSEKNLEVGFLIGSLSKEETLGVISIRDRVKSVIRSYMLGSLSPNNISTLSKIERLSIIQKKDDEVLKIINSSEKFSELYKICSMNSDFLSAGIKNTLSNSASDFARKEASTIYSDDEKGFKKFISVCRRRAYKEAVISLKERELQKWRDVGNKLYVLPSKK
jgi:hypothetical protein